MRSQMLRSGAALGALALLMHAAPASSSPIASYTDLLGGTPIANFDGFRETTLISTQYAGVTFGQVGGGLPQIDRYDSTGIVSGCGNSTWDCGYGSSSDSGVLTGSPNSLTPFSTTAGITMTFATPQSAVEAFLSDTSPLGGYVVSAYNSSSVLLETFTVPGSAILPPGYTGGVFPAPGTFPLPGIYVGFNRPGADISMLVIGPSTASGDSFAIDDLRAAGVPEPSSIALLGAGLVAAWRVRRKTT
jgi:hypothetical protein